LESEKLGWRLVDIIYFNSIQNKTKQNKTKQNKTREEIKRQTEINNEDQPEENQ
jgi:hypothetical protein